MGELSGEMYAGKVRTQFTKTTTLSRSKSKIYRDKYKPHLDNLKQYHFRKQTPQGDIIVGFSGYGNKHLFNDAWIESGGLQKSDLPKLHILLMKATYAGEAPLKKQRTDDFNHFYYYSVKLHGKIAYFVAPQKVDT